MGRPLLLAALVLSACQVTRVQSQPMVTVVDHLCHDGIGLAPCTQYAETWAVETAGLLDRAVAAGFACQGSLCELATDLDGRPVRLRLAVSPHSLWLEIELPRGRGEDARRLLPAFTEISARVRGQLGLPVDPSR